MVAGLRWGMIKLNAMADQDSPATKADLAAVRTELKTDIADLRTELKADIADLRTELKADIAAVRTELKTDIADLRTELKADIAAVREEIAAVRGELHAGLMFLKDQMQEMSRDIETRVLNALYGYAQTNDQKHALAQATSAIVVARVEVVEGRVLEVEKRLNIPPASPTP